jgi:hypothetical protein
MHANLRVKAPILLSYFNQNYVSANFGKKISNIRFNKKSVSWFQLVPCRQADMKRPMGTSLKLYVVNTS